MSIIAVQDFYRAAYYRCRLEHGLSPARAIQRVGGPKLAAANVGAIGVLARSSDEAHALVSKARAATEDFFVNFILREEPQPLSIALDASAPVVQFSWGMPAREVVSVVRAAGARWGCRSAALSAPARRSRLVWRSTLAEVKRREGTTSLVRAGRLRVSQLG